MVVSRRTRSGFRAEASTRRASIAEPLEFRIRPNTSVSWQGLLNHAVPLRMTNRALAGRNANDMEVAMDLTAKTCVPCKGGIPPLGREEAETYLREVQAVPRSRPSACWLRRGDRVR